MTSNPHSFLYPQATADLFFVPIEKFLTYLNSTEQEKNVKEIEYTVVYLTCGPWHIIMLNKWSPWDMPCINVCWIYYNYFLICLPFLYQCTKYYILRSFKEKKYDPILSSRCFVQIFLNNVSTDNESSLCYLIWRYKYHRLSPEVISHQVFMRPFRFNIITTNKSSFISSYTGPYFSFLDIFFS